MDEVTLIAQCVLKLKKQNTKIKQLEEENKKLKQECKQLKVNLTIEEKKNQDNNSKIEILTNMVKKTHIFVHEDGSFVMSNTQELEQIRNTILTQLSFDNILNSIEELNHDLQEKLSKLNKYIKKVLGKNYADSDVMMMTYKIDEYIELAKFNTYKFEYVSTPEEIIRVTDRNGISTEISLKDLNGEITNKIIESLPNNLLVESEIKNEKRNKDIEDNQNQIEIQVGSTLCKIDDLRSESIYKVTGYKEDTDTYILTNNILSADIVERSRDKIYPLRFHN